MSSKVFFMGMDGVPHSLLLHLIQEGHVPTLAKLVESGALVKTHSVLPPVSSVAWTSITTGKNPAGHGLFGFIDRTPNPLQVFLPTARNIKAARIWEILGRHGKSSLIMNVPATYPPKELNGILVGGFESPSLAKATYPASLALELDKFGYVIDIDPQRARQDKDYILPALHKMLESRKKALFNLLQKRDWGFILCHFMGTDRLHHFLWREYEENNPKYKEGFLAYYHTLDGVIGEIIEHLPTDTVFMAASDHGFCAAKKEVQLNRWLRDNGFLTLEKEGSEELSAISHASKAYSMIPGRIYVNLHGREAIGSVSGTDYEKVVSEIKEKIMTLIDPETNEQIITDVFTREKAYHGSYINDAPDLVVLSKDGYELKASLKANSLLTNSTMSGMHTYGDAFWLTVGRNISSTADSILDIPPTILQVMGIEGERLDRDGSLV